MERRNFPAILLAVMGTAASCCAGEASTLDEASEGWKLTSKSGEVTLYTRPRVSSSLKEFKAVGQIDASSRAVYNVIDDLDAYADFMPFTKECRIVKKEGDVVLTYQRLSPKIVSVLDYTLRIWKKSWPALGGFAYLNRW